MRPAVFLDRDGVLSRALIRSGKSYAPVRFEDFRLLPGATQSVRRLRRAGYAVVVVTNQPDIGNGVVAPETVAAMHERLRLRVAVDDIFVCPHSQNDGCDCRKPRPGMLLSAARKHRLDLARSYMVGDRASDVEAGRRAGCHTIFIDRGYAEARPESADATLRSLNAAAAFILSHPI